jgi:hypothetical protein
MASRSEPELCGISVGTSRTELSKAMRGIGPRTHKGVHRHRFRSNAGKDIKGMGRNDIGEVRDYSNAVPGIRSLVCRSVSRQRGMRKSRGRVRT